MLNVILLIFLLFSTRNISFNQVKLEISNSTKYRVYFIQNNRRLILLNSQNSRVSNQRDREHIGDSNIII